MNITQESESREPLPFSTPQDRATRDRLEKTTTALLRLSDALEARIANLEARLADLEQEQEHTRG